MKINCNIGDSLQAQIDFCLFCASKTWNNRQKSYLGYFNTAFNSNLVTWFSANCENKWHYIFYNETVLIHLCEGYNVFFFCSAFRLNKLNCTIWLERWSRCFQLEAINILSTKLVEGVGGNLARGILGVLVFGLLWLFFLWRGLRAHVIRLPRAATCRIRANIRPVTIELCNFSVKRAFFFVISRNTVVVTTLAKSECQWFPLSLNLLRSCAEVWIFCRLARCY